MSKLADYTDKDLIKDFEKIEKENRQYDGFDAYDRAILSNVWSLDSEDKKLLDYYVNLQMSTAQYLLHSKLEYGHHTNDRLDIRKGIIYPVYYWHTSRRLVEEAWRLTSPATLLCIQLRVNKANNFRIALVRFWDHTWGSSPKMLAPKITKIEDVKL